MWLGLVVVGSRCGCHSLWLPEVVYVQTHNTEVVGLNPARVIIRAPLAKKATRNHLIRSTSLEKTHSPVSGFC